MSHDPADPPPPGKAPSLLRSFSFAWEGIGLLVQRERNARIHFGCLVLVIVVGFAVGLSLKDWAIVVLAMALVLVAEALNSAVEAVVDLVTPEFHPQAKVAKDIAAGAVLMAATAALVAGLLIFVPALIRRL